MSTATSSRIQFWVPGIRDGSGGIQGFCRDVLSALITAFPRVSIHVIIKNDQPIDDDPLFSSGRVTWTSAARCPGPIRSLAFALLGAVSTLRHRPSLILTGHVNFLPALQAIARLHAAPRIAFLHGIDVWNPLPRRSQDALRLCAKRLCVSKYTRSRAASAQEMPEESMEVFPCTFDSQRYQLTSAKPPMLLERYGLQPHQKILFTVSRLAASERYKGHDEVLEALPAIINHEPNVHYLIGGSGDLRSVFEQKARELGIGDQVTFCGFIPNDELAAHFQLCDAFVMPSRGEGFGIVFLEAMGCGKPVIGGNQDGSVDALDGGRLGVLVDPLNIEELAESISQILAKTHPNRLLFDPQALHNAAVETFGPDAFRQRLSNALTPLLDPRSL